MAGQQTPRRVRNSKIVKVSTQLFDYQKEIIDQLSLTTGWSRGVFYRYAVDYFIVCLKDSIKAKKIRGQNLKIPEELDNMTEEEIRDLPTWNS